MNEFRIYFECNYFSQSVLFTQKKNIIKVLFLVYIFVRSFVILFVQRYNGVPFLY